MDKASRKKLGLFKGYQRLREQEQSDPLPLTFTTILSANRPVRALLTSRRANLPAYFEAGEIVTFGVTSHAIRSARGDARPPFKILDGDAVGEKRLRAFYNEVSPRRTLFPVLPNPLPAGLKWSDFVVLEKDGKIVASAAMWNQQSIRQIRVASYHPLLSFIRPVINPLLKMLGYFPLPPAPSEMDCLYVAYRLTRHESPAEFESLLAAISSRIANRILFFALHEHDPLLPTALRLTAWHYRSMLYTVSFAPEPIPITFKHPPYIELAML